MSGKRQQQALSAARAESERREAQAAAENQRRLKREMYERRAA